MKVLPRGSTSFPGIILGAPCLAPAPAGLGLRTEAHGHVLQTIGVCLPRMEEEVEAKLRQEQVQVNFLLDAPRLSLSAGETALVPVRGSKGYCGSRLVEDDPTAPVRLAEVGPIRSAVGMLFLFNHGPLDVELEMGQAVATTKPAPVVFVAGAVPC